MLQNPLWLISLLAKGFLKGFRGVECYGFWYALDQGLEARMAPRVMLRTGSSGSGSSGGGSASSSGVSGSGVRGRSK